MNPNHFEMSDEIICNRCRTTAYKDPELEATVFCNLCAQQLVVELELALRSIDAATDLATARRRANKALGLIL